MEINDLSTVTIILRGFELDKVEAEAQAMENTNIKNIEVTTNSPNYLKTISEIKSKYPHINIGAGTVTTYDQAIKSIDAGASFILSPIMLSKDIVKLCNDNNVICVPAAMTPSEINQMFDLGADVVKVFPATTVGPKFFKDIQAPLGKLNLMAVGGVNINNAKQFLDNGCKYLGIGTGMFNKKDIETKNIEKMRESIKDFSKLTEE